ncbi:putative f-box domain protein [Diplodia seriata]|uniref:Putative f-box domain protein n=1 Tax=Diplodia seriata TaxID=420778 RepID=A0A0G2F0D1_9PEZI|nr:putative f-box domain protein [Diplodia seriata]
MGSWDCYCAICGSALGAAHVSARPRTARFNRWREAEHRKAQADETETENNDAEKSDDADDADDDTYSIDSYEEKFSYDPAILSEADLEWMRPVHILGFNPDAKGVSKAFIAGPGHYWDYGGVEFDGELGDGVPHYYSVVSDITAVFPFHWCCFELLLKALTGTADPGMLEKDLLYSIMEDLAPDCASRLDLDYGTPDPEDGQFWESRAGEEASNLESVPNSTD